MADMSDIVVNHLPDLTWNKAKMNGGNLGGLVQSLEEARPIRPMTASDMEGQPAFSLSEISREEAEEVLAQAPAQSPEKYVAGKTPIYHPQTFGTGLGAEFGAALAERTPRVLYAEIPDGTDGGHTLLRFAPKDGSQCASAVVKVGKKAKLSLTVSFEACSSDLCGQAACTLHGRKNSDVFFSLRIIVCEGAQLSLSQVQTLRREDSFCSDIGISEAEGASVSVCLMDLGAGHVFTGLQPELEGKARFEGRHGFLAGRGDRIDVGYNAVQRGKKTVTDMNFDGVLIGDAKKILRDTIDFRAGSSGSEGKEQENMLLLSEDVENRSIPLILCEEEDMAGAHGATIGHLDEDMMFYLESRGIDRKSAEEMMVRARLRYASAGVAEEQVRERIMAVIDEMLASRA